MDQTLVYRPMPVLISPADRRGAVCAVGAAFMTALGLGEASAKRHAGKRGKSRVSPKPGKGSHGRNRRDSDVDRAETPAAAADPADTAPETPSAPNGRVQAERRKKRRKPNGSASPSVTLLSGEAASVAAGEVALLTVACVKGLAISGGVISFNEDCFLADSFRDNTANSWDVSVNCPAGSGGGVFIPQAICLG